MKSWSRLWTSFDRPPLGIPKGRAIRAAFSVCGSLVAVVCATYLAGMAPQLHLMKLCVGCDGPDELMQWQRRFGDGHAVHVTRMWPKREDELLAGGSIFWVFKGVMLARQRIVRLDEHRQDDGIRRCALILDRAMIAVTAVPRRPFQGWRYLDAADAPADMPRGREGDAALPPQMAAALAEMGLV